jgi:nucleotide-binding universal stress UspA family protein
MSPATAQHLPMSGWPPGATGRSGAGRSVLVPIIRGQAAGPLLDLGEAIAGENPGTSTALGLVELPFSRGIGISAAERSRQLLHWIARTGFEREGVRGRALRLQTRVTANAAQSIREVTIENHIDTVLLELPAAGSPRRHGLMSILRNLADDPPADLVIARPDPQAPNRKLAPRSVLVPLRGGANAQLALAVGVALARHAGAKLTLMHVYDRNHHHARLEREAAVFRELVGDSARFGAEVVESVAEDPLVTLLEAARQYDAVVMGAHANPSRKGLLVGPAMAEAIDQLPKTFFFTRSMVAEA